jgi:Flp pilus assembly protein TadG
MTTIAGRDVSQLQARRTGRAKRLLGSLRGLRGKQGEAGSMMIETAIVLPVFCIMLFGFFEYSLGLAAYMNAVYAARIGARFASLHSLSSQSPATQSQVEAVVQANLFLPFFSGGTAPYSAVYYGQAQYRTSSAGNYQGDLVGVGVFWYQNFNVPFIPAQSSLISTQAYRVIER